MRPKSVRVIPAVAGVRTRHRAVLIALMLGAAIAFPLGVLASHQFSDVPDSNPYHTDIDALVDSGVTTGCGGGKYCPSAFVTREQMAAFMNRLGALQAGKTPVVNAAKVDGLDEVLAAEDIEVVQIGPWSTLPLGSPALTVFGTLSYSLVHKPSAGTGSVFLYLDTPGMIGDVAYGLKSIEICYMPSPDVVATTTQVGVSSDDLLFLAIDDQTDRTLESGGCYTLAVATPAAGATTLMIILDYASATDAYLKNVTTTWTPVG